MRYISFDIKNYRAIAQLTVPLESKLIPLVGVNECGKTTILQAIYAFDHTNDAEYDGRHLKSIRNLYETVDLDSSVSSKIALRVKNVIESCQTIDTQIEKGTLQLEQDEQPFEFTPEKIQKLLGNPEKELITTITRHLGDQTYSCSLELSEILKTKTVQQQFAKQLVSRLPYILYNDDFADRPPSEILIPTVKPKFLSGWLAIYERLFRQTDPNYSLFSLISEPDPRRRASILSDVEARLNSTLSTAWKNFSAEKKNVVNVSLSISEGEEKKLEIRIIEQLNNKNRFFDVLDRSKGFVWYFNFIMKTQFNPKIAGKVEDTVFLLDEPGSYLHSSAQDKLSGKLKEISKNYGIVIYCTHSHHLLNPNEIPLKNIHIVEKSKAKTICLTPIDRYKSKSEKTSALQPVYEALDLPVAEFFSDSSVLLLVEGINDKYFLEALIPSIPGLKILPGTSADSILKNIPYMLTYNKKFICLWDNDEQGILSQKRAKKQFALQEDILMVLPLEKKQKRRMEDILSEVDYQVLRNELKLDHTAGYDLIIPTIFFQDKKVKAKLTASLSAEAKMSLKIIEKMLQTALLKVNNLDS